MSDLDWVAAGTTIFYLSIFFEDCNAIGGPHLWVKNTETDLRSKQSGSVRSWETSNSWPHAARRGDGDDEEHVARGAEQEARRPHRAAEGAAGSSVFGSS